MLDEGLYHEDGQIDEEVYVWGSFLQSRMHRRGVRCADCHDPHSGNQLRDGDAVCVACHSPGPPARFPTLTAADYTTPGHRRHEVPIACVDCHMTGKRYMGHDFRRDHSFRVPRPDLGTQIGTPDACTQCHTDRDAGWAAGELTGVAEDRVAADFARAFHDSATAMRRAEPVLAAIAAADAFAPIVRASALARLGAYEGVVSEQAIVDGLASPNALVRLGALEAATRFDTARLARYVRPLTGDPLRAVRVDAARLLARNGIDPGQHAGADLEAAITLNADRPESGVDRALVEEGLGDVVRAEASYRAALAIEPGHPAASINLANLLQRTGRDDEGLAPLTLSFAQNPDVAALAQALGYWHARNSDGAAALEYLRTATELDAGSPAARYVYGVALASLGAAGSGIDYLAALSAEFPEHEPTLFALATLSRDSGDIPAALRYTESLIAIAPHEARYRELASQLHSIPQR